MERGAAQKDAANLDTQEFGRVKNVFLEVIDLAPEARESRLRELLGETPSLRPVVDELIENYCPDNDSVLTAPFSPPERSQLLQPGDLFGDRFEVVRLRGQGGMGHVYEVEDRVLGKRVALKTLRPDLVDLPKTAQFFREEVLNAREVSHPNVCKIFDLHVDPKRDDALAFTMELLEGKTLRELMESKGTLQQGEARRLAQQMAAGLDALHSAGIVHCDFKPENVILIGEEGEETVKITDFGISRRTISEGLSSWRGPAGTRDYMAPEVERGERPTPAADLFGFGVVLQEMLIGTRRPVPSDSLPSGGWTMAVRQCVAENPDDRSETAGSALKLLVRKRFALAAWLIAAALLIALLVARSWIFPPLPIERRVVVLPISTVVSGEEIDEVAQGLTITIPMRLAQYEAEDGEFSIVPPDEVLRLEISDSQQALELVDANLAVRGILLLEGDQVELTLSLIDSATAKVLETAIVEGAFSRVRSVQNGAVARIAAMIEARPRFESVRDIDSPDTSAHTYYVRAMVYLQRSDRMEDLNYAEELFNRAINEDPNHAESYAGLASVFWYRYQMTRDSDWVPLATKAAEKALELDGDSVPARVVMALVLNGAGRNDEALAHLAHAREIEPRNSQIYEVEGRVHEARGDYGKAESALVKAVQLLPSSWKLHKRLGAFYFRRARFDEAAESFQEVVRLVPDSAQAMSNLGVVLYQAGRYEEAKTQFRRTLEVERRAPTLASLGKILIEEEKYEEAAEYIREAVEQAPDDYKIWGNLGSAYKWGGEPRYREAYENAIRCLREDEIAVNPKPAYFAFLAVYSAAIDRRAESEAALEQALEDQERLTNRDLNLIAQTYEILGERSKAIEYLRKAIEAGFPTGSLARVPRYRELLKSKDWNSSLTKARHPPH